VGTQDKRSAAREKKDIQETIRYIKAMKTMMIIPISPKSPVPFSRA
jgi:hypothetical protein